MWFVITRNVYDSSKLHHRMFESYNMECRQYLINLSVITLNVFYSPCYTTGCHIITWNVFYLGRLYHGVIDPDKLHHGMLHYSLCVITWSAGSVFYFSCYNTEMMKLWPCTEYYHGYNMEMQVQHCYNPECCRVLTLCCIHRVSEDWKSTFLHLRLSLISISRVPSMPFPFH